MSGVPKSTTNINGLRQMIADLLAKTWTTTWVYIYTQLEDRVDGNSVAANVAGNGARPPLGGV